MYDEAAAERVRQALGRARLRRDERLEERKMFGGLAVLVNGKMCCGLLGSDLVVRVPETEREQAMRSLHVRPMDFTGRALSGFVYVAAAGYRTSGQLDRWIGHGLRFVRERRGSADAPRRAARDTTGAGSRQRARGATAAARRGLRRSPPRSPRSRRRRRSP